MAWDAENLMFDPSSVSGQPRAPAPTTQAIQQQQRNPGDQPGVTIGMDAAGGGDLWARLQDAAKRGLISPDQLKAAASKLGYGPGGNKFATGVSEPDIASNGQGLAGKLGTAAGELVGGTGRAIYDKINASAAPAADSIGGGAALNLNPPSPAWNQ